MGTLIGTSGFIYEEWRGAFYPADLPKEDFLRYYSMFFPFVELDFSYYKMPESWRLDQMADSTPKEFIFTIKAHRSLTHELRTDWPSIAAEFKAALRGRSFRSRLGGVLLQFPHNFHYEGPNRVYLGELCSELSDFPLFVEFRNAEWAIPPVVEGARKRGIGLVAVDAPDLPNLPGRALPMTSDGTYIRFHGRNAEYWWSGENSLRYEYSYSDAELRDWAKEIVSAEAQSSTIFAAFNNHPHGFSVDNARRLKVLVDAEHPRLAPFLKNP